MQVRRTGMELTGTLEDRIAAAAHYGFTAEELKEKEGLKEFFGF